MNADGVIDFTKLEKELYAAVEQDARYQRENAAKFRAVEQKVASYEEFKDIVAASHLRPLDKNDKEGLTKRNQPWNPYANKQEQKHVGNVDKEVSDMKVPRNNHEFLKQWRQYGDNRTEKYSFLMKIGGAKLCEIFKAEISMGLLGEIVIVLHDYWNTSDVDDIYDIMYNLSLVKRFNLSLQFLSKDETMAVAKLINDLEYSFRERKDEGIGTETEMNEKSFQLLKELYQIKT